MRSVKPEIRILGVDDAPFSFEDDTTELIGTVFRGGSYMEGVMKKEIEVDGFDVTEKILEMVNGSRHGDQIQVVMLDGITFGGFNVVDLERINKEGGVEVIAVSRNRPDIDRMERGMENVEESERRFRTIERAGTAKEHDLEEGNVYFQNHGLGDPKAREILDLTCRGLVPEPVRASHMIGAALKNEESKGRA